MSYKVSMMYYGSRLRPVEEVVSEAMEAEDFSVVNHYWLMLATLRTIGCADNVT